MLLTPHFVFLHMPKTGGTFVRQALLDTLPESTKVETLWNHAPARRIPGRRGSAADAARMMASAVLADGAMTITGNERMRSRPIGELGNSGTSSPLMWKMQAIPGLICGISSA